MLINREKYGWNRLTPPKSTPAWLKFLLQFTNFFSLLLLGGGTLCFIGYGIDRDKDKVNLSLGIVLYVVVTITSTFSFLQEQKSENIMEGFKNMIPKKCKSIRDGDIVIIDAQELVPGDIVELNDGDQVPADIRVMRSNELKVDNSSLTGESEPVDRRPELGVDGEGKLVTQPMEADNLVFYTTIVNSGTARGIVIGTADRTAMGQIAGLATETSNEKTPIAHELERFILLISAVAIVLGLAFFFIGLALKTDIIKNVVFAIGIIVANVPEGLLATVTVSLALTAKRMHTKNVLVKNLEAVETLGSTTIIASDKTGTLTQNRMTVQHCWYDNTVFKTPAARNLIHLEEVMNMDYGDEKLFDRNSATFKKLQMVTTLCNNANFLLKNDADESTLDLGESMKDPTFNMLGVGCSGDASESGLLKFIEPLGSATTYREENPKCFEIKFNSTNKWQLSIHTMKETGKRMCVLKGAPERVLQKCKSICINGVAQPLSKEMADKYEAANAELGGLGERVLGFAYKEMPEGADFEYKNKPEPNFTFDDLTFAGLCSLIDPPREGVPEAVEKCKRARIKVFMVTGDHPITATAIAKQIGIIDQEKLDAGKATVIKGDDIRDWQELATKEEQLVQWDKALDHEQIVWARVSPAHKLLIVENCQRRGEVVAVTGDGVNDAPALKKGDIGVAMGIAGKDVSKEAADMILMDDNFASIVNGVEEGRLIFDNLKKSIAYTLTSNIPEIMPFLCYIVIRIPLPLSTVLILCVDLGTDMVPAISLAHETKEADIMDRPPRNSATDRLVNRRLISFAYLQIGIMQALAGFFTYMVVLNDYGYSPRTLMQNGLPWLETSILCTVGDNGRPDVCGYGCQNVYVDKEAKNPVQLDYCVGGCSIPISSSTVDPFSEFTADGFRGTPDACMRSCDWFNGEVINGEVSEEYGVSADEVAMFEKLCNVNASFGFNRDEVKDAPQAPAGAKYWWNGRQQIYPNAGFQAAALEYAQTAYFISIIVVQWADLLIAKTRKLSLFEQGMNNQFMNFGLLFETILGCALCYTRPFNTVFGTRPLHILHWFPGVPWSILIFVYDEVRKLLIRRKPDGWLDRFTYW